MLNTTVFFSTRSTTFRQFPASQSWLIICINLWKFSLFFFVKTARFQKICRDILFVQNGVRNASVFFYRPSGTFRRSFSAEFLLLAGVFKFFPRKRRALATIVKRRFSFGTGRATRLYFFQREIEDFLSDTSRRRRRIYLFMRRKDSFFYGKTVHFRGNRREAIFVRDAALDATVFFPTRSETFYRTPPSPRSRIYMRNEDYFFMGKRRRLEEIVERRFLFAARSGTRLYFFRIDP